MRRIKLMIIAVAAAAMLSACGSDGGRGVSSNNVENVINQQIAAEDAKTEEATTAEHIPPTTEAPVVEDVTEQSQDIEPATGITIDDVPEYDPLEYLDNVDYVSDPDETVDIDLTAMSSDMVYATVYQMMSYPEDYVGLKIKADGNYFVGWYDETQKYYHYCLIADAAACCQRGLEFVWGDGSHIYPEEFPEDGADIEVSGTFEIYKDFEDDPYTYVRLADADFAVLDNTYNR